MKTDKLPPSENIEDRRGEKKPKTQGMTLEEMLAWAEETRRFYKPAAESKIAEDAGVNDIKGKKPNG